MEGRKEGGGCLNHGLKDFTEGEETQDLTAFFARINQKYGTGFTMAISYRVRYQNLYRVGITIAFVIHSVDPIQSLDLSVRLILLDRSVINRDKMPLPLIVGEGTAPLRRPLFTRLIRFDSAKHMYFPATTLPESLSPTFFAVFEPCDRALRLIIFRTPSTVSLPSVMWSPRRTRRKSAPSVIPPVWQYRLITSRVGGPMYNVAPGVPLAVRSVFDEWMVNPPPISSTFTATTSPIRNRQSLISRTSAESRHPVTVLSAWARMKTRSTSPHVMPSTWPRPRSLPLRRIPASVLSVISKI